MKNREEKGMHVSQNISWTIQKGSWIIHFVLTGIFWASYSQLFGYAKAWQLTAITYNISTFIFFHWMIGDPFDATYRDFTFWEQMAVQLGQTSTLKFMAIYPVLLFMFVSRLVEWKVKYFIPGVISLVLVVVPKLGFMHMRRIFGIKRHD
ncbi:hypothetical protein PAPHI01_0730 [Pancytospora philotis]|nr:hypothetical protein PAPHI01_0730 [Pancytospora philotis]